MTSKDCDHVTEKARFGRICACINSHHGRAAFMVSPGRSLVQLISLLVPVGLYLTK